MMPAQIIFAGFAVLILILLYALRREESVVKSLLVWWGVVCFLYALFILTQTTMQSRAIQGGLAFVIGTIACGLAFVIEHLDRRWTVQRKEPQAYAVKRGRRPQ
jgi:hypothetical protein